MLGLGVCQTQDLPIFLPFPGLSLQLPEGVVWCSFDVSESSLSVFFLLLFMFLVLTIKETTSKSEFMEVYPSVFF